MIEYNIDFYKIEDIADIVQEECAELIQACIKYQRSSGFGMITTCDVKTARGMLVTEIGDVISSCQSLVYKVDSELYEQSIKTYDNKDAIDSLSLDDRIHHLRTIRELVYKCECFMQSINDICRLKEQLLRNSAIRESICRESKNIIFHCYRVMEVTGITMDEVLDSIRIADEKVRKRIDESIDHNS